MSENIKLIQVPVSLLLDFPSKKDSEAPVNYCTFFYKIRCDSFYNIPSSIGKSPKPGIGLGKKIDIAKKSLSPSPNKYNISSDFDLTKKNAAMGKFALGREVYFSYIKKIKYNGIFVENETPAPGKY